jgi:hypothetical protein
MNKKMPVTIDGKEEIVIVITDLEDEILKDICPKCHTPRGQTTSFPSLRCKEWNKRLWLISCYCGNLKAYYVLP